MLRAALFTIMTSECGIYITSLFLSKGTSFFPDLMLPENPVPDLAAPLELSVTQRVLKQMLNQEAVRSGLSRVLT